LYRDGTIRLPATVLAHPKTRETSVPATTTVAIRTNAAERKNSDIGRVLHNLGTRKGMLKRVIAKSL
jgi:hypothetical protein